MPASPRDEEVHGWQAATTWCPACGFVYVTVVPIRTPLEQCPNCLAWHPTPAWDARRDDDLEWVEVV